MPYTETQRRAAFAEIGRRKKGKKARIYKGMSTGSLEEYAQAPLKKKKKSRGAVQRKAFGGGSDSDYA